MNIFDLDGTLRSIKGSAHLAPRGMDKFINENWVNWQNFVNKNGLPINKNIELFNKTEKPIILTSSLFGTKEWCEKHNLNPSLIIERDMKNELPSFQYKKNFIDDNVKKITLWVDDNKEVCDYASQQGLNVVFVNKPTVFSI